MIKTDCGWFDTSDRLIGLLSDDDVMAYVSKRLLTKYTVYFKNVFSNVSSNKDEEVFRSYVTEKSTHLYVSYLEDNVLTTDMCQDLGFITLGDRLGTVGFNDRVYKVTTVYPMEQKLRDKMKGKYVSYLDMTRDMMAGDNWSEYKTHYSSSPPNEACYCIRLMDAWESLSMDKIEIMRMDSMYITVLKLMIEYVDEIVY